jgi:predicted acetyltransferase
MEANHVTLSYLAPFAYGYYRRFGYEHVFDHAHQVMAASDLPRVKPTDWSGTITRYGNDGLAQINDFYARQPQNQRGGLIRPAWVATLPDSQTSLVGRNLPQCGCQYRGLFDL